MDWYTVCNLSSEVGGLRSSSLRFAHLAHLTNAGGDAIEQKRYHSGKMWVREIDSERLNILNWFDKRVGLEVGFPNM